MLPRKRKCVFCGAGFLYVRGMSYTKKTCSTKCHSDYMASKRFGADNPAWKGRLVTTSSVHDWVRRNFIKTGSCEFCNKEKPTEWSNKEHDYKRDRIGWQELCRKCHMHYDQERFGCRFRRVKTTKNPRNWAKSYI